jgi:hypothetical protein
MPESIVSYPEERVLEIENTISNFNLENGLSEGSIQLKGGNAEGKKAVDLSAVNDITIYEEEYYSDEELAAFDNNLSDAEKQEKFPVAWVEFVYDYPYGDSH